MFSVQCSLYTVRTEYVSQCTIVGAVCLDIGFRHMFSALDCAAFGWCMYGVAEDSETTAFQQ